MITTPAYLDTFTTISEVRETNNVPVIGICSDIETYVIKHNRNQAPCSRLFNEFIAHYFLRIWQIPTPEIAIINVQAKHIQQHKSSLIQPAYFRVPCFGSRYYKDAKEFDRYFEEVSKAEKRRFLYKEDLLKIVLFDIWLANDDRTYNNPNLLINPTEDGWTFTAIDHEAIFNGNNLDKGIYPLSLEDTLLYHPAALKIMGKLLKDIDTINNIINSTYICIDQCKTEVDSILKLVPNEWQINTQEIKQLLIEHLFTKEWLDTTRTVFLEFIERSN